MATKAQLFRYSQERSKPKRRPRPAKARTKLAVPGRATKNEHTHAKGGRKAMVVLEETRGRPTRKSTRKSANGQRGAQALEHVRVMKHATPAARHGRKGV